VDFREIDSFRRFVAQKGVAPPVYRRGMEAIEAVDLLVTIEQMGDHVLDMARRGCLSYGAAEDLLAALADCFANPIKHAARVLRIGAELRNHDL
jgi:hypothetical protein